MFIKRLKIAKEKKTTVVPILARHSTMQSIQSLETKEQIQNSPTNTIIPIYCHDHLEFTDFIREKFLF